MNSSSEFRQPAVHRVVVTRTLPDTDSTVNSGRWRAGAGHAVAAGARACPDGRPGLAGGVHSGRGVRRRGATCVRLRHLRAGVAGLRGAGPAAAGGLAPPRRGGEVRPRVHWVRGPEKKYFWLRSEKYDRSTSYQIKRMLSSEYFKLSKTPPFFCLVSRVFHRVF